MQAIPHFMVRERGGGFVKNQKFGSLRECFDDFHQLSLAHAQLRYFCRGIDLHLELFEQQARFAVERRPIDEAGAHRLRAEKDIFRHGHFLDEGQFLVDHRDVGRLRVRGRLETRQRIVDVEIALVGSVAMNA